MLFAVLKFGNANVLIKSYNTLHKGMLLKLSVYILYYERKDDYHHRDNIFYIIIDACYFDNAFYVQ